MRRNRLNRRKAALFGSGENGQTLILVAVALTSVLAMAALAIDVVTLYTFHTEAQRSADAAALAGARIFVESGFTTDVCPPPLAASLQTLAAQQATAIAQQNKVGGQPPGVTVIFPAITSGCSNPEIEVEVQRTNLPTFFARIWSQTLGSVSASALAEAYNQSPSNASTSQVIPVAPRCVKPLLLQNCDPDPSHQAGPASQCGGRIKTFVRPNNGSLSNPGQYPAGVIGEPLLLSSACTPTSGPNCLTYHPLAIPAATNACPACATSSSGFQYDLECCNPTPLACGQTLSAFVGGNAAAGGQCLIHQTSGSGQDTLDTSVFPFRIHAGTSNPYTGTNPQTSIQANDVISASDSIVNIPLYEGPPVGAGPVTINGYLQVFINTVDATGDVHATVLNVAGCGASPSGTPVVGSGPAIAVRLIQR